MTASAVQPHLKTVTGEIMPLESLEITGQIADSLATLELSQVYRNQGSKNIEAVYTFPLPFDGVLLGLQATIAERKLEGSVMGKQDAEDGYEDAITDGNSAIMLEQQAPGLYTINLGNLMAGEEAEIKIRYALPLKWTGDQLRITFPLTVAPRYGEPDFGKLKPFAEPECDFVIEYPLSVKLSVYGALAQSSIISPTHRLSMEPIGDTMEVSLQSGGDHPDRDLVLLLDQAEGSTCSLSTQILENSQFGHAVFQLPSNKAQGPIATKLLVDCSGSMAGESMTIAKHALHYLVSHSKSGDQMSLTAFGSRYEHLENGVFHTVTDDGLPLNAQRWISDLNADLGGTEMESALRAVFSLSGSEVPANVLMITDGEIWDIDGVITACRHAGVRVFIIGVGLSPAESNLRLLAEATGGAVEFLSPSESTEAAVGRQLNRMRQPIITNAKLEIPGEPKWIVPNPADTHLYAGDTVHFWYETKGIEAEDQASLILDDYRSTKFSVQTSTVENNEESSELARLAVAARLKAWDTKKASNEEINNYTELAVQYQLVTSKTNFLMIEDRGENQAMDLPDTRAVKHMIRADIASFSCASAVSCHAYDSTTVSESFSEYLEVPAFLRRQAYDQPDESISGVIEEPGREGQLSGSDCSAINAYFNFYEELPLSASGSHGLERIALTDESISELTKLLALSISEESVLLAFWNAILQTPVKRELQREVIWWIKHQRAMTSPEKNLCDSMVKHLADSECHLVKWDTDCADALFEAYKSRLFSRRFSAF